jgi:hypothetical protein
LTNCRGTSTNSFTASDMVEVWRSADYFEEGETLQTVYFRILTKDR